MEQEKLDEREQWRKWARKEKEKVEKVISKSIVV
jgi:hypothetical protein